MGIQECHLTVVGIQECHLTVVGIQECHLTVVGIQECHFLPINVVDSLGTDELGPSDSWEWREGRLFSYELILAFLIKNHWVYTFGASHLVSLASGNEANTLDVGNMAQGSLSAR